ncbi:MAG: hypothetical protein ACF8QF_11915 [Phycisphaerales bacterium]
MASGWSGASRRGFAARSLAGVAIALVVMGWVIFSRTANRDELKSNLSVQMMEVILDAPEQEDVSVYTRAFERVHGQAFSDAYSMGGRRTSARFDHDAYLNAVFSELIAQARAEGCEEDAAYFEATLALNLGR